jgi:hypothetical protein
LRVEEMLDPPPDFFRLFVGVALIPKSLPRPRYLSGLLFNDLGLDISSGAPGMVGFEKKRDLKVLRPCPGERSGVVTPLEL